MIALIKSQKGSGHVALEEVDIPRISADEALLAVDYCGICGTDLHVREDTFRNYPPVILGHEFVGRVVEEGRDVKGMMDRNAHYAVLGAIGVQCGKCRYCRNGQFMFCPDRRGMGHGINGAFAEYAKVRPEQLFRLSESTDAIEGAMVEPFAVAVAVVLENSRVRPGDTAIITGPGPIGLLCLQMLVRQDVRTIVVGLPEDQSRFELATKLGAWLTLDAMNDPVDEIIKDQTDGLGVDAAYEVSGAGPAVDTCLQALRPLGSYTQVGHFGKPINVNYDLIAFKQLSVQGSVGYTRNSWDKAISLLDQGMKPSSIISHVMPLQDWERGFGLFQRREATKVVLEIT